jgi:hypothetical protein
VEPFRTWPIRLFGKQRIATPDTAAFANAHRSYRPTPIASSAPPAVALSAAYVELAVYLRLL